MTLPMAPGRPVNVLVLSASLREASLNTRLAQLAAKILSGLGAHVDVVGLRDVDCPTYDGDTEAEAGIPEGAQRLARRLVASDAFVLASPEYNAGMPGGLKNVIDWVSRMKPQPWQGKHAMLLSASPSLVGGNRGLWALRMPLEHLGVYVHPAMFSLARAHEGFGDDGGLLDPGLTDRLSLALAQFRELVEAAVHYPCARHAWMEFLGEHLDEETARTEFPPT
ncbi:MAG: NAD(P)H-dependent oxidoreductase [Mycobacteriales bacterium]